MIFLCCGIVAMSDLCLFVGVLLSFYYCVFFPNDKVSLWPVSSFVLALRRAVLVDDLVGDALVLCVALSLFNDYVLLPTFRMLEQIGSAPSLLQIVYGHVFLEYL